MLKHMGFIGLKIIYYTNNRLLATSFTQRFHLGMSTGLIPISPNIKRRQLAEPPSYELWREWYKKDLNNCSGIVYRNFLERTGISLSGDSFDDLFWRHLYEFSSKRLCRWREKPRSVDFTGYDVSGASEL